MGRYLRVVFEDHVPESDGDRVARETEKTRKYIGEGWAVAKVTESDEKHWKSIISAEVAMFVG